MICRRVVLALLVVLPVGGCAAPTPVVSGPPPFSEVDPYTSPYFITLEGTGLVESQGAERVYSLGVNACSKFDQGRTIASEVDGLTTEARLGVEAGSLVGSAVLHLCPQHQQAARDYVDAH